MAGGIGSQLGAVSRSPRREHLSEARWLRITLTVIALIFLGLFLGMPIAMVLAQALQKGFAFYGRSLSDPDALSAIRLTLTVAAVSFPLNLLFGLAAAWAIPCPA